MWYAWVSRKRQPLIHLDDDHSGYYKWCLKNVGSLPGILSARIDIISDDENGITEPETIAEAEPYGYQGARPTLGHPDRGELSEFLKPGVHPDDIPDEVKPYVTIIAHNDSQGWWIGEAQKWILAAFVDGVHVAGVFSQG